MLWMKYGSRFFILRVHKFFEKISTHHLTVLITSVIVRIEQRKEILHPRSFCSERMLAFDR